MSSPGSPQPPNPASYEPGSRSIPSLRRDSCISLSSDPRVRVTRERRGLRERNPGLERERDERVPEVVQANWLAARTV